MRTSRRRLAGAAQALVGVVAVAVGVASLVSLPNVRLFSARAAATAQPSATATIPVPDVPEKALEGRTGTLVAALDARVRTQNAIQVEAGPLRRIYQVGETRVLADVTPEGRVRQLTLGHDRQANDTFQPDPVDWSLDAARTLARTWLPLDAAFVRTEPFIFRGSPAGQRDVHTSAALATVFPAAVYTAYNAAGPTGICAVTYYQTSSGSVAFFLVGIV